MKLLTKGDKEVVGPIDLGMVEVGETQQYEFVLFNENQSIVEDIKIEFDNTVEKEDIQIIKAPIFLEQKEKAPFIFSWTPSLKVKLGLKTNVRIHGREIFKP